MGFTENYLALRNKREPDKEKKEGAGKSAPSVGSTGANAGNDFTSRYLALQKQKGSNLGVSLPALPTVSTQTRRQKQNAVSATKTEQNERLKGLSLPSIPSASAGAAQKPQGLSLPEMPAGSADQENMMPEWARRMVDRYKPENNQNIRKNPVAAAEEKKKSAPQTGVDWRGIPMAQSPDGIRREDLPGSRIQTPSLTQRIGDTLSGAAKTYGASLINTGGNLADLTQGSRDADTQQELARAQEQYDKALRDYQETEALAKAYPGDKHWQKDLEASRNVLQAAEWELKAYQMSSQAQREATKQFYAAADQMAASGQADVERAKAGLGSLGRFAVDVGVGGAQLGADIAGGIATGGGTMLPLLLRSYGGGAQEARQEGASAGQAAAYGAASALTEALTEKISSLGNFQTKAFGSGALDDILEGVVGAVERIGKTEAGRKALNRAASAGVNFLSEGAEEFVSGIVSPLLKWAIYSKEPINWKETMEEAAYEFLVGGGIGAISGGVGGTNTGEVQQAYLSNATNRANDSAYRAMSEKGVFSQEARQAARDALAKMDDARTRTGAEAIGLPNSGSDAETDREGMGTTDQGIRQPEAQTTREAAENKPEGVPSPTTEARQQTENAGGPVKDGTAAEGSAQRDLTGTKETLGENIMRQMMENRGGFSAEGRDVSKADSRLLENLGKVTRSDIRVVPQAELDRIAGKSGANGAQVGDQLYISESADRPTVEVAKHELTHRLQDVAPEEYRTFRDYVAEVYRTDGTLEQYIEGMIRSRENAGISLTQEQALDEIAADYAGELMVDEKAVRRLAGENRGLLEKMLDGLREFIEKIRKKLGGGQTAQTEELERAAKLWQDALEAAGRSAEGSPEATIRGGSMESAEKLRGLQLMDDRDYSQVEKAKNEEKPEGLRLRAVDDPGASETKAGKISEASETDRYSTKGDADLKKEIDRLRRQNQRLKEQMKRTDRAEVNREAVQRQARELLKEYSSGYDKQTLYSRIEALYNGIANQTLSESDMRKEARSIAEDILSENREQTNRLYEEYQELRKELRTQGISISPEYRADLESAGGYDGLRKRFFGKLRIGDNGTAVDRVYDDLAGRYPELFPDDILHPADQLLRITDVLDDLQPVMGNTYESNMDRAAEYLAGELLERYYDTPEKAPTFADKQARKMEEQRAEDREKMRAAVEKERKIREKKLSELQKKNREYYQRQRENRNMRELQQKTLKQLQWLSKNRDKAPSELRAEFDKVLGDIDIYAVNAANEMNWSKKHQATWRDLADMYKDAKENDPNFMPSAELHRIMERLNADKIGDMDVSALQDLYKAAVGLRTEYYNRKNVINDEQGRLFAEVYEGAKEEIKGAAGGAKGEESYDMSKADKFLNMEQLTPMNYLERMGGWNTEGHFYSMARQLEQGERDMRRYRVQAESMMEDFLKKNADWVKRSDGQGKNAIWYEIEVPELLELKMGDKPIFGDNVKVYMTPAQKVHMYLESKNYDNLRHMAGGRTFADKALYSKGKRQEAFAQGTTIRLAPETVKKLVSNLTAEEKAMAEALEKYYNQFAAGEINKKSNILYGYDKAMSSSYAPIYSDQNYVAKEIGIYDTTAEGVGRLKPRQYSQNPSYQISAMDAFERHVDQTSRFVGMAIPARNWHNLLDWREKNNSMRKVISQKWGDASVKYIEDLLNTLQGGGTKGKKTLEGLADKALSNYITGVFGANPGIVLKQAASFPQFAAALGWENLPGAFGKANEQIINAYTSELAYRTLGYSTPETAQLKNNPNWLDTNKVTQFALRGGAITAMDAATVKRAWPWAERKVRKEHPELEMGTREQIEAGESPFYKKVAEEFENAVSLTQPMYDEMHRPDIMKNSGGIQRAFTMFKTVPLQQYNTLRRAFGEAAAANQQAKKAKGTEAQKQARAKAKQAARTAGAAVTATLASVLMLEGIEFLNQWFKNAAKGYRDDDDKLTAESALMTAARKAAGDMTGMVVGGGELTDILANILMKEKWYGIEIPGGEQLNEVIESIQSAAGTIEKIVGDGANIVENGGDLKEYFRRNAGDYAGAAKEIAEKAAMYLGGLPVENIEKYIMGGLQHAAPELYEAAQSTFNTPEKNDMTGLTGKALEARVGSVMRTRGVDISDETAAELAALYQAGYKEAIPSNTPESLTVNEESRKLDAYQKQTYDRAWSETLADCMDELISSKDYQEESEETRARILDKLYDYAREKAKEAVFDDYEVKESTRKADAVIQAGALPGEWAEWATAPEKGMKDSENRMREIRELRYSIWGDEVKDAALKGVLSEKDYDRLQAARKAGISIEKWCDLYDDIAKQKIKRTGKSGSPSQEDVTNALKGSGLTEKQKDAIWKGYGWKGEREK